MTDRIPLEKGGQDNRAPYRPRRRRKPKETKPLPKPPPPPPPSTEMAIDMARRSRTLRELRLIWKHSGDMGLRTAELEDVIRQRAEHLKEIGQTE